MIVLAEFEPLDTVGGARVTLRASSADDPSVTGLNSVRWWPAISESPSITMSLFKGDFDGEIEAGQASLTVRADGLAKLDANARRYRWAGAPIRFYVGARGQAWPWTQAFEGIVERFEGKGNAIRITARVDTEPFQKDVLASKYAGTTGIEGGADLKNKPKPLLMGRCVNVEPVLINAVDSIYQFHGYGPIQAVNALYERGSSFGASVGDFATYAALQAATIPAGRWATCLASGLIRLGAPAYGVITGDVDGDNTGGWKRKTGEIITRIAAIAGVSGGALDATSMTTLDTALSGLPNQGRIGLYLTDQTTVLNLAARLAAPCNAQVGVSFLGKLFAMRAQIGTPTLTLDAQARQLPAVIDSTETDVRPPFTMIEFGWGRSWRVHSFNEIAFYSELVDRGAYSASETYREGNIVQDQGSSWLYINPTPTSGNAPPTLPTTSNSYWRVMAVAGADGADGIDGTNGTNGANAKSIYVISDRQNITYNAAGSPAPSTQTTVFTIQPQNLSTASYRIAATQADGTVIDAWSFFNGTGLTNNGDNTFNTTSTSFNITASQFDAARGTTKGIIVTVSHADGVSDKISIVVAQDGAAGVSATDIYLTAASLNFDFDSTGAIKFTQVPRVFTASMKSGDTDVTASTTFTISATSGCTASIAGSTITITAMSTAGYVEVQGVYGAITRTKRVTTTKTQDAAPAPTSSGGTVGISGSLLSSQTSYPASPQSQITVTSSSGGQLRGIIDLTYDIDLAPSGTRTTTLAAKIVYRLAGSGGAWLDFTTEVSSSVSAFATTSDLSSGYLSTNQVKTGLTASTSYEVGVMIRKSAGGAFTSYMDGNLTVSQS